MLQRLASDEARGWSPRLWQLPRNVLEQKSKPRAATGSQPLLIFGHLGFWTYICCLCVYVFVFFAGGGGGGG